MNVKAEGREWCMNNSISSKICIKSEEKEDYEQKVCMLNRVEYYR
jgi:hypothetical protein